MYANDICERVRAVVKIPFIKSDIGVIVSLRVILMGHVPKGFFWLVGFGCFAHRTYGVMFVACTLVDATEQ